MKVLITNDDGIRAEGLWVLASWAREQGHHVVVVAPKHNSSGQSGAITLGKPLTVTETKPGEWAVGGTPADCVRVAFAFLGLQPDLVLSGINHGLNLGHDVYASGTIGAARMAAIHGIPAAAFSAEASDWDLAADLVSRHGPAIVDAALDLNGQAIVSANFPAQGGTRLTSAELSGPRFDDALQWAEFDGNQHIVRLDFVPRGIGRLERNTDADAIARGLSTLTCLSLTPATPLHGELSKESLA